MSMMRVRFVGNSDRMLVQMSRVVFRTSVTYPPNVYV